jgi:MFS family permease
VADAMHDAQATRVTFATMCLVGLFARLSYAMARTPVLALFAIHLGAPPEAIGLVVGISTITGIVFKMPSGILSDIIGRRTMLIVGLCVFAFVPFAYFWVTGFWGLFLVRFLHGFATAIYGPVAMAVVAEIAGSHKAELISWFSSLTIIGTLCGAPLGGFLLWWLTRSAPADLATFHNIYAVVGAFGILALVLALTRLGALSPGELSADQRRSLPAVVARFSEGVRQMVSDYAIIMTSSMEGLQNMAVGALEAFLPVYAVTIAGLNPFQAGMLWAVQIVATLAAKPLMGRFADRHGRKPLIVGGMVLCAGAFVLIPTTGSLGALVALAVAFGLGEALVTSSTAAMVADMCDKRHYGAAMGAFGTYFDIGHAAGPITAGLLLAAFAENYLAAFLPIAIAMLLATVLFALTVSERRNDLGGR